MELPNLKLIQPPMVCLNGLLVKMPFPSVKTVDQFFQRFTRIDQL